MQLQSDKMSVQYCLQYLKNNDIRNIVLCPGSRNAPFIVSLAQDNFFNIISIVDERTAGFVAMGIAKKISKPAVVICTSGSAVLNLAPAVLEAFYQEIPLLVLTADRPKSTFNRGENQTFNQEYVFNNYINQQFSIEENEPIIQLQKIFQSINSSLFEPKYLGTVHLNFHFEEPLYQKVESQKIEIEDFKNIDLYEALPIEKLAQLQGKKILLYISTINLSKSQWKAINIIASENHWLVFAEITSNIFGQNIHNSIDLILLNLSLNDYPEVVITMGGQIVSKGFRTFLSKNSEIIHFDIHTKQRNWNFFSRHFTHITSDYTSILDYLAENIKGNKSYQERMDSLSKKLIRYQTEFFDSNQYTEFHICNELFSFFELNSSIFWGNSSIIRYANWSQWLQRTDLKHYSNRGVSGIDGVLATSVGFQLMNSNQKMYCVLGDLSALYESNSFWAATQIENLCVLVFNNFGGKIFEIIQKI